MRYLIGFSLIVLAGWLISCNLGKYDWESLSHIFAAIVLLITGGFILAIKPELLEGNKNGHN